MIQQHSTSCDPRVQAAVVELQILLRRRYPDATCEVSVRADDLDAINLYATVDETDSDNVLDVVLPRVFELQDAGLPIHVIPLRTPEREEQVRREVHATHRLLLRHCQPGKATSCHTDSKDRVLPSSLTNRMDQR